MARVDEDHTILPAIRTFIHKGNEPYLPFLASCRASPHFWPVLVFCPAEGERLSWPKWLVTNRGGLPIRRRSVLTGPGV